MAGVGSGGVLWSKSVLCFVVLFCSGAVALRCCAAVLGCRGGAVWWRGLGSAVRWGGVGRFVTLRGLVWSGRVLSDVVLCCVAWMYIHTYIHS